ncbi:virulence-related outer membrane protein [Xenorhabdus beddingii]|uniref:Virulence-related outer membrane protein n=1 Tax=Xenorhabdus beddingii TaxID=40578 RepID=A0A1Y2SLQ7_9GAMM|nr:Ail/Lom family outer membrane beta-barrel protein [Xenorhabdus beddingii]OTA19830.1 virulence-related outer membrane protein [Xenorhabdus beddingii]
MKKTLFISAILAGLSITSLTANANEHNTISVGYAQSKMSDESFKEIFDKPKGFNLKYRYEFNDRLGIIGSYTRTEKSYSNTVNNITGKVEYASLMAGPSYRFNEYVSAYALVGAAAGKITGTQTTTFLGRSYTVSTDSQDEASVAYGAGLQFNPHPNIAVDVSYEHAKPGDVKVGTWTVGVGYRF